MAQGNILQFSRLKSPSLNEEKLSASNILWKAPALPIQDKLHSPGFTFEASALTTPYHASALSQNFPQKEPRGLIGAYIRTCSRWNLGLTQTYTLLGYRAEFGPFMDSLMSTYSPPLTQDIVDRIGYILSVGLGLGALFDESIEAELNWLQTPKKDLSGEIPLAHMLKGHFANLISVARLVELERGL